MTSHDLRDCHMLEGASNFDPWKCTLQILLEEVDLWYLVGKDMVLPIDPKNLAKHTRKSIKVKQIKKMAKDMYDDMITLSRRMFLKNKHSVAESPIMR